MALSGSVAVTLTQQLELQFGWTAAQDAVAGGSKIYWVMFLRAGEDGGVDAVPGSPWSVDIDGQVFSGTTNITVAPGSLKELAAGSVFLTHDPFGERSFDFAFSQYVNIYGEAGYIDTVTGSGTGVLDPLDPEAAPILGAESVYLGQVLNVKPQGPLGAVFRLRYCLGQAQGVIGEGLTEAVDWTVPEALGEQLPNTDRGVLRILCDAYRDGVPVGRSREAAVTVLVPEAAVPGVEQLVWTDAGAVAGLDQPVAGLARLTVTVTAAGAMGSRVVRQEVTLGGRPLGAPVEAGEQSLTVTVTDSRGRVGRAETVLTVLPYSGPRVKLSAHRCLEDGTADDTGAWARVRAALEWTWLGSGTEAWVAITAGEQEVLRQTLVPQGEAAAGDRITSEAVEVLIPAEESRGLELQGVLRDGAREAVHGMVLSSAYCLLDLLYGGRGLALGTVAREPGFLCAMDARFTGRVLLPDGTELLQRLAALEAQSE